MYIYRKHFSCQIVATEESLAVLELLDTRVFFIRNTAIKTLKTTTSHEVINKPLQFSTFTHSFVETSTPLRLKSVDLFKHKLLRRQFIFREV
jgi:hypothetical protein